MKKKGEWTERPKWHVTVRPTGTPGVFEMKQGGHFVRALVTDPATGRRKTIKKVMRGATLGEAVRWLEQERSAVKEHEPRRRASRTRFSDFAVSLFERKVQARDIKSAAGRRKWRDILVHLIDGTRDEEGNLLVRGFGDFYVDAIRAAHLESWRAQVTAKLVTPKLYTPTTANGWRSVLLVIMKAAKRELELPSNPAADLPSFDTSEHVTYADDETNSLTPDEARAFMAKLRELYPQHFGMALLGLATGLRPSSLRPLRRRGPDADIDFKTGVLLVRRSQTYGDVPMETTKTGKRQRIALPRSVVDVLKWHCETQLETPEQRESDLLFPSIDGSFRAISVLNKPFALVAREVGITRRFSQRGLRRTFQDLARAANVDKFVTRSISGHATESMHELYSTISAAEQVKAIGGIVSNVVPLAARRARQRRAS